MKYTALLPMTLLLFSLLSCSKEDNNRDVSFQEIKSATQASKQSGSIIKEELNSNRILFLTYPEYAVESYSLIKFIAGLMRERGDLTVIYPGLPKSSEGREPIDLLREEAPMLGFIEFLELYDFFEKWDISFTGTLKQTGTVNNSLMILAPVNRLDEIKELTLSAYKEDDIIKVIMAGTPITTSKEDVIEKLPEIKKISSRRFTDDWFDIFMIMGLVEDYTPVTALELYTLENYLTAPEDFIELNSSFIESMQIKKMNLYLKKEIDDSF